MATKKAVPRAKAPAKKASTKKASAKKSTKKAATKTSAQKASTKKTASTETASTADPRAARIEALTHAFTALGAPRPEKWARSHVEEGVDQIGRFIFLRALWSRVVKDGRFLDKIRKEKNELTPVVERLIMGGVPESDIVALVRAMQVRLLVDVAQIVDDPHDNDEGVRWGVWRMDKRGLPLWQLGELRLDILDVDPLDDV
jgi:hypothetical protein